jgi:hypothetical protein
MMAVSGLDAHERRWAIDLVARHDYWTAGLLWLSIAANSDAGGAERARGALWSWLARYNRVFTPPTDDQVAQYSLGIEQLRGEPRLEQEMRSLVPALSARRQR